MEAVERFKHILTVASRAGDIVTTAMIVIALIVMVAMRDPYYQTLSIVLIDVVLMMNMLVRIVRDPFFFVDDKRLIDRAKEVIVDGSDNIEVESHNEDIESMEVERAKHAHRLVKMTNVAQFIMQEITSIVMFGSATTLLIMTVTADEDVVTAITLLGCMVAVFVALFATVILHKKRLLQFESSLFRLTFGEIFTINQFRDESDPAAEETVK